MPKRRPTVFLQKVAALLKRSVRIARMSTKPIIPRLVRLKIKARRNVRPKGHHYRFTMEYEFSPSSTPLIAYDSNDLNHPRRFRDIYRSLLYVCGCWGKVALSATMDRDYIGDEFLGDVESEGDSVDERAERFIEKFYEEMRMQRLASV